MACRSNLIGYLYSNRIYSWLFFSFLFLRGRPPILYLRRIGCEKLLITVRLVFFLPTHWEGNSVFFFSFGPCRITPPPLNVLATMKTGSSSKKKAPFHSVRSRISRGRELSYWVYVLYCTSIVSVPINCRDCRCLRWEIQWKTIEGVLGPSFRLSQFHRQRPSMIRLIDWVQWIYS